MRPSSIGRRSSSNPPARASIFEREEKNAGRSDARRTTQASKSKAPTQVDSSHIPRPKIRSSSSERTSIRRSNLKPPGKTPLRQQHLSVQPVRVSNAASALPTGATPRASSGRAHLELPQGLRHRSPSAERASGFGAKAPRKDNRQLGDKVYQGEMLAKIDQYFYEIQQTSLLNANGSLKPITLKMFVETTNCLISLLDIKLKLTIGNYTDEVPKIAKKLRYPGSVTKSWLKTANTMHSWPQVLGWLSWLCDVCEARDKAELSFGIDRIPFLANNIDEETEQRETFLAMVNIYRAWNEEKLEEEAALVEKRVREMNEQYGDIDAAIREEERLLEIEKASIAVGNKQEADLDEEIAKLQESLERAKHEEDKERESINLMKGRVKRVTAETKQLNIECNTLKDQIKKDSVRQDELMKIVVNQKMSVDKRNEIVKQCSEIEIQIYQFDSYIQDIEKELYVLDLKLASCNQSLYKAILAYNKDIIMLVSCDTGADPESLKMPEMNFLDPDFIDVLKTKEAAVMNLKENIKKQCAQTESSIEANSNKLDSLNEQLEALRKENKDYVAKAHEQRLCIQQIQCQAKDAEAKLKEKIKRLEEDISHLQQTTPDVETAANNLSEAQDKYQAVVRRQEYVEKRMERFFDRFFAILARQTKDIDTMLKKLPEHHELFKP